VKTALGINTTTELIETEERPTRRRRSDLRLPPRRPSSASSPWRRCSHWPTKPVSDKRSMYRPPVSASGTSPPGRTVFDRRARRSCWSRRST